MSKTREGSRKAGGEGGRDGAKIGAEDGRRGGGVDRVAGPTWACPGPVGTSRSARASVFSLTLELPVFPRHKTVYCTPTLEPLHPVYTHPGTTAPSIHPPSIHPP